MKLLTAATGVAILAAPFLAAIQAQSSNGFAKINGENIYYEVDGKSSLVVFLDQLGVKAAHFLGNSQGGRVALHFARDYPDRVLSITLHGTSSPDGFALQWTGDDRPRFPSFRSSRAL